MTLDQRLYTQYIYKYKNSDNFSTVEKRLTKIDIGNNFLIQDLSEHSDAEVLDALNTAMAAERTRYYIEGDPKFFLNIFKVNKEEYIIILSVVTALFYEDDNLINRLTISLFNCLYDKAVEWRSRSNDKAEASASYWSRNFASINPDDFSIVPRSKECIEMETFMADEALCKDFCDFIAKGNNPQALCVTAVGSLAASLQQKDRLLINVCTNGRVLPGAPIIFIRQPDMKHEYESVLELNSYIREYSYCTKDELYKIIGNRFISRTGATVYYSSSGSFTDLFIELTPEKLYIQPALDTMGTPLTIFFRSFNDRLSISYIYDTEVLKGIDIEKLHDFLCRAMSSYIAAENGNVSNKSQADAKSAQEPVPAAAAKEIQSSASNRTEDIKCRLIGQHPISSGLTAEEIRDFAKSFNVIRRNTMQTIAIYKEPLDRLYIVCNGRIDVLGRDADYCFNPLFIAGPKEVFGIESLTNEPESPATYIASTDNVIVLSISIKDLIPMCEKHPDMFKYLLTKQSQLLHRFQKLWLTV